MMHSVEPRARIRLREVLADVASRGAIVEPGPFRRLDHDGLRLLFIDARDENELQGVLISDRSEPAAAVPGGRLARALPARPGGARAHLALENGDVHLDPTPPSSNTYRRIAFETFDYSFDVEDVMGTGPCSESPSEMSMPRLLRGARLLRDARRQAARLRAREDRRALRDPAAPALRAAGRTDRLRGARRPARHAPRRAARARSGVLLCIGLVVAYYALLSFGSSSPRRAPFRRPRALDAEPRVRGDGDPAAAAARGAASSERGGGGAAARLPPPAARPGRAGGGGGARGARRDRRPARARRARARVRRARGDRARAARRGSPSARTAPRLHLRRVVHGGLLGPVLGEALPRLRPAARRAARDARLREAGAPVPRPALALAQRLARSRCGAARSAPTSRRTPRRADCLAARPDAGARCWPRASPPGAPIRRFHDAGGRHADLHVEEPAAARRARRPRLLVIDLDKARAGERRDARRAHGAS